jgi:hypothetical protein
MAPFLGRCQAALHALGRWSAWLAPTGTREKSGTARIKNLGAIRPLPKDSRLCAVAFGATLTQSAESHLLKLHQF